MLSFSLTQPLSKHLPRGEDHQAWQFFFNHEGELALPWSALVWAGLGCTFPTASSCRRLLQLPTQKLQLLLLLPLG